MGQQQKDSSDLKANLAFLDSGLEKVDQYERDLMLVNENTDVAREDEKRLRQDVAAQTKVRLSGDLNIDVGLGGDLLVEVGLSGDLDINVGLSGGVEVGVGNGRIVRSSIDSSIGNSRGSSDNR